MNNLKTIRKEKKKTQLQVANMLGVTQAAYSMYESGAREPDKDTLFKLADYFEVSVDYLLGRTDTPNAESVPARPSYEYSPTDGVVPLKIIGTISAGYNGEAVEEILGEQNFLASALRGYPPEECFLLQVKGNSMYPDYQDKDIVLVHRQTSVDSGSVAVILYNGNAATLKKVIYKPNEDWLELIPKNPEYPTKRIEGADLQECQVLGKVVCIVFAER